MAEKIRYTRRDLKGPDEFITTFGRIMAWSRENRSKVATGLAVVLAVLALAVGTRAWLRWQDARAAAEIWPYLDQVREMLAAPAEADPGRMTAMERSIAPLADKYEGTRAAVYAEYYLGSIAFRRGDYESSLSRFRGALENGRNEGIMEYLLHRGIAGSLEAKGDFAGAAESYGKAAETAGPGMRAEAQFDRARALELSGKKGEAVALLRKIGEESPGTVQKDLVDIKKARME